MIENKSGLDMPDSMILNKEEELQKIESIDDLK
jgi:hypothetical protein